MSRPEQSPHADASSWGSSRDLMSHEISLVNGQSIYSTAPAGFPGFDQPPTSRRQTAFAHGAYVEASYLGDNVTSPMSLDFIQSATDLPMSGPQAISARRSGNRVSPIGTPVDFFGPHTGHSVHTDPGFAWASEENQPIRASSLQSYSAQSLSPALSNDQNPLQSPKLEDEDSDSSPKRSGGTQGEGRKKPRRKTHNAIEKRYRVKLNEKIAELRDSIPTLRQTVPSTPGGSPIGEGSRTDLVASQKINKANILEKATEYVKHLESCNRRLQSELQQARAESSQHASHSMPHPPFTSPESGHDPANFAFDTGPPRRQGHGEGYYPVPGLYPDDVRPY